MAQQTINDGETGLVVRGKLNDNFTDVYGKSMHVTMLAGAQTLTNQPNTEQDLATATLTTTLRVYVDTTYHTSVRVVANVTTQSASLNNPRLYPQFSTDGGSNWTTVGDGTVASGDALTLASTGQKFSNWVALPAGAKADVLWRIAQHGGNGTEDPACSGSLQFK